MRMRRAVRMVGKASRPGAGTQMRRRNRRIFLTGSMKLRTRIGTQIRTRRKRKVRSRCRTEKTGLGH